MCSEFGLDQYPQLQKLQKSTFGLMGALPAGFCPTAKSPPPAKFKFAKWGNSTGFSFSTSRTVWEKILKKHIKCVHENI